MGKLANCRSCKRQIVWLKTAKGKNIPVDASQLALDSTHFDRDRMVSHFATCPNADQHRRRQ